MSAGSFCTVINCMDGRTQVAVSEYLRKRFEADYVDTITEPGPNRVLAEKTPEAQVESIKARLSISVEKHGSKGVALVGHASCTGNPADEETQEGQTQAACAWVREQYPDLTVIALWVDENGCVWEVEDEEEAD